MLGSVTIDFYSLMIGLGLAVLTMVGCVIMLLGWFFYLSTKLRRSSTLDGQPHGPPLISPGTWGEPDLAPPSTSAAARAEVVALDAVWTPRVSQFLLIMCRRRPRLRERLGFLAGWPARGMDCEIWRR